MSQTKPFFIPQKEFDLINVMNEELIADIISTEKIVLFSGGRGGLGNINFKSSTNILEGKAIPLTN